MLETFRYKHKTYAQSPRRKGERERCKKEFEKQWPKKFPQFDEKHYTLNKLNQLEVGSLQRSTSRQMENKLENKLFKDETKEKC